MDVIEHFNQRKIRKVVNTYYNLLSSKGFAIIGTPNISSRPYASKRRLDTHEYDKAIKYLNKISSLPEPKPEDFHDYTEGEQHSNVIQNVYLLLCDAYFGKVNELLDKHEFDQAIHICKKVISLDYKDIMGQVQNVL